MSFFRDEIDRLVNAGLYRTPRLIQSGQSGRVIIDGKEVILLCSNNYLGLADHPEIKAASIEAIRAFGVGSGASRLVSGNMILHEKLEAAIAAFKGTEAAILFNSGYAANTGSIPALAGRGDTIHSDRLNHASIVDGALLSRAGLIRYPHNDTAALRKALENTRNSGRSLVVTDGVFSMDGDIAPLREIAALKDDFEFILMVDDAHAAAVMGTGGKGSAELLGVAEAVDIQMGTLGKGLGSCGAYVAGSAEMIDYLRNSSRSYIFSTSLPPATLAASIKAIEIARSAEGDQLRRTLEKNRLLFTGTLKESGLNIAGSCTQIIPIIVGEADKTMKISAELLADGVFVQGIRPPTVPAGSCRLRCTVMATHTSADLEFAAERIVATAKRHGLI